MSLDLSVIEQDDAEIELYIALTALTEYTRKTGRATCLQIEMPTGQLEIAKRRG